MTECNQPDGGKNWAGKRIRALRREIGLSQNQLAIKLQNAGVDVAKNAIQQLEQGQRSIRDMELFTLANVFGVAMEELFQTVSK